MNLFSDISSEGTAVLLVTHDARVAAQAGRILFMLDGKIVSELKFLKSGGRDIEGRLSKVTAKMQEIGI